MARTRFIKSGPTRPFDHVEISEGDWINLKRKLNYGEASELYDATYESQVGGTHAGGAVRKMRMSEFNFMRIFLYTLDWSFLDESGVRLPVSLENIRALDTDTTDEIHAAINNIETAQREAERNPTAPVAALAVVPPPDSSIRTSDGSSPVPVGLSQAAPTD